MRRSVPATLLRWFDTSHAPVVAAGDPRARRADWARVVPFVILHAACLGVIWAGASPVAVWTAAALYVVRMFAITGFYHRYFSHRTYSTSRPVQFAFALLGASAVQRGPLWWAAHHRYHHRHADEEDDLHSPSQHGFLWSHMGWITSRAHFRTQIELVPDLAKFPELRFLDRFDTLVPVALAAALFGAGEWLAHAAPSLRTSGLQMLVWGFFVSTVVLFHATCTINSLAHVIGRRRYATKDTSGNSFALSLITLGEGWHNNHHRYEGATRQGFFWWEIDPTWWALRALAAVGIVWDLRPVPAHVLAEAAR